MAACLFTLRRVPPDLLISNKISVRRRLVWEETSSIEMRIALKGQLIVISALATYKRWKNDNEKTNDDKYETLKEEFRKHHKLAAAIIDKL